MTNPMRAAANESSSAKMKNMGVKISTADMGDDEGEGHALPATDGTQGVASGAYATGYSKDGRSISDIEGKKAKPRIDRPGQFAHGGNVGAAKKGKGTTVNVIVAPGHSAPPAPVPPIPGPVPAGAAPPAPPMPMPPPAGPGAMMRQAGGRAYKKGGVVKMDAGAGSGEGRLEKVEAYGKNAKPGK